MTIHPRQVLSAFGWSFIQSWGSQLTKLGVFIVLARLLDPRDIGLVAFAMVFIQGAQSFALTGVSDALIQKKDLNQETINAVFWLNMLIATTLAVVLFFAAPFLQVWFKMEGLASVVRWICPALLLQALAAVQIAQFQRKLKMRPVALRELLASIVGGAVAIAAALQGMGVYSLVLHALVGQALGTLFLWWSSSWRPSLDVNWNDLRDLAAFSIHRTGSTAMAFLNTRLDDLFVGMFLGPAALGFYSVAYRVVRAISDISTVVTSRAAFPLFSRLQHEKPALQAAFSNVTKVSMAAACGLFGGLLLFAQEVVIVLFGNRWLLSCSAMQILCLAGVATNILNTNRTMLRACGLARREFLSYLSQVLLSLMAFYIAARFSIEAVAFAAILVQLLVMPSTLRLSMRASSTPPSMYLKSLLAPVTVFFAAAASALVFGVLAAGLGLPSLAGALVFCVVYLLLTAVLFRKPIARFCSFLHFPKSCGLSSP